MSRVLPDWSTSVLDSLLASRVIRDEQLGGLSQLALLEVAIQFVRANASGEHFDTEQAISVARNRSSDERYRDKRAAA